MHDTNASYFHPRATATPGRAATGILGRFSGTVGIEASRCAASLASGRIVGGCVRCSGAGVTAPAPESVPRRRAVGSRALRQTPAQGVQAPVGAVRLRRVGNE